MRDKKKILRNSILFIVIIFITFYIMFKDQSVSDILKEVKNLNKTHIFIAIECMCLYFVCDAINIGRTLKSLGEKSTFFRNIKYSLIGFFFSSVTPAASGGQPMQIYYMKKDNISVANSTLALLLNLTCMQIVTISVALVSLIFNYSCLTPPLIILFIIGIALNSSALALLLIAILSEKLARKLVNFFVKILKVFKLKNIDKIQEKIENELEKYKSNAIIIRKNRGLLTKTLITTLIQFLIYYSISYFVYRSFGLQGHSIARIVSIQSVLFATVSGIPSPGAIGVSEGGFIEIYKTIYTENMIRSAVIVNRGINFYLFVLISAIVVMIYTFKDKKGGNVMKEIILKIEGMHCGGCENRIQNAVSQIEGVESVIANHENGTVKVTLKEGIDENTIKEAVSDIGFDVVE